MQWLLMITNLKQHYSNKVNSFTQHISFILLINNTQDTSRDTVLEEEDCRGRIPKSGIIM